MATGAAKKGRALGGAEEIVRNAYIEPKSEEGKEKLRALVRQFRPALERLPWPVLMAIHDSLFDLDGQPYRKEA